MQRSVIRLTIQAFSIFLYVASSQITWIWATLHMLYLCSLNAGLLRADFTSPIWLRNFSVLTFDLYACELILAWECVWRTVFALAKWGDEFSPAFTPWYFTPEFLLIRLMVVFTQMTSTVLLIEASFQITSIWLAFHLCWSQALAAHRWRTF